MSDEYGRRLLLTTLHREARITPERSFCLIPKTDDIEHGFRAITFDQVSRAVNYLSSWLLNQFHTHDPSLQHLTLAYIGIPDPCYAIVVYATIQCRWKIFLPSPRNPVTVNLALFEQTECQGLVYSEQITPVARSLQQQSPSLLAVCLPSLEELLSAPKYDFDYPFTYDQIHDEPIVVFHSSGSTGLPRPITYTHGAFATFDKRDFPTVNGRDNHDSLGLLRYEQAGERIFDVFPPYHLAGFTTKIIVPLFNMTVPVFASPTRPPSGPLAATIIRKTQPRCIVLPPAIIELIHCEPDSSEIFNNLETVLYAGGPLSDVIGNQISTRTKVCQSYGSTEIGQIRQLFPKPEDWAYLEFHPHEKIQFREHIEGLHELVVFSGPQVASTSALFHNFPDVKEYHTKDLFEPHPSKPGLWKFKARKDDILVFSSGEKLNPLPLELTMTAVPGVKGALVVGQGYSRSALLIELDPDAIPSNPLENLWSFIELGNSLLPAHGRVSKNMVLFAEEHKPFVRAGKGTVIRRMTENLYEDKIQQLLTSVLTAPKPVAISLTPSAFHINEVKKFIRSVFNQISIDSSLRDSDNFFMYGMDSIKAIDALSHLKASLNAIKPGISFDWLVLEMIYVHSTIDRLASIILAFLNEGKLPEKRDRVAEMEKRIAEYTNNLPVIASRRKNKKSRTTFTVAITGSTGYLGQHLLTELSNNKFVSRIYCLDRNPKAASATKPNSSIRPEIVPIRVNFSATNLGMQESEYAELLANCDLIIHNAWQVDFNLPLSHFDIHLNATRTLINLSTTSNLTMKIIFISSISATGIWTARGNIQQTIPERIIDDLSSTLPIGYAKSKRVAEHILTIASQTSNVPVTVIRLGELAPSKNGSWANRDLAAAFLKTCKSSKRVPRDSVETIDWIPVDWAATMVCDLVVHELTHDDVNSIQTLNLVNPHPCPWPNLLDTVVDWCGADTQIVSMAEWVENLHRVDTGDISIFSAFPAIRMLPFFEMMARRGAMHAYEMRAREGIGSREKMDVMVDESVMAQWLEKIGAGED